VFVVTQGISVL